MVHSPRNAVVNMQLGTIPPCAPMCPNVLMEAASSMELPLFCKLIIDTCNDVHHMKPIGVINLKFYQIFFSFFFYRRGEPSIIFKKQKISSNCRFHSGAQVRGCCLERLEQRSTVR